VFIPILSFPILSLYALHITILFLVSLFRAFHLVIYIFPFVHTTTDFSQPFQAIAELVGYMQMDHDRFLPHPYPLNNHDLFISFYAAVTPHLYVK
jgi:hypothetical protein